MVYVPRNLVVSLPTNLTFSEGAFVTVGSIALHGVRQAGLSVGETVCVIGMGLVGQITSQICKASGCKVVCIDVDEKKVALGLQLGADYGNTNLGKQTKDAVLRLSNGLGSDSVIITAGSKSSSIISTAPELVRDRGKVIAVGDVGHNIPRRAYYEKEIDLRQSRSFGPGRYDPSYEEYGNDYPVGYVRWTENRNMESFLGLVQDGKIKLSELISHRFKIDNGLKAYEGLLGKKKDPLF